MTNKKIEFYNHEDDGFQIIYIDGVFFDAIHFNDDQYGYGVITLLEHLGHEVFWGFHDDLPEEYESFLREREFLYD